MDQVKARPDEDHAMYGMLHAEGRRSPKLMKSADKFGH
jgi:hypothetical protein